MAWTLDRKKKHEMMNIDVTECSVKFKHCGCKFEIAILIFKSKVVWVNGLERVTVTSSEPILCIESQMGNS
jgi:hypothetical protein